MKKSTLFTLAVFLLLIPATILLGSRLPGRGYYLTSTAIIIEMLLPFILAFERKKPQARELVTIAVMCAISIVARVAIPIPHIKPMFAVIMLAGVAFGPQSGFMVGAIGAFVSNFFIGQGPYTPWQMMAYGAGGMLAGFLAQRGLLGHNRWRLALFGFFASVFLVGPLLDLSSVFWMLSEFSWSGALTIFGSGVPINLVQGITTFSMMALFGTALLQRLDRVKTKYGME